MSTNLTTLYVQQYSTNIMLLLQQKGSKIRGAVMEGTHVGNQASPVDQVGAVEANKVTTRFAPIVRTDALLDRRWVNPQDYDLAQFIDNFDRLRILIDPQSSYVQSSVYALGRRIDDEIINAFFGAASTGTTGTVSTTFPSSNVPTGQVVPVNQEATPNTGLTVAKLRAGRKQLMRNFVDLDSDPLVCVIAASQHDDLLRETQVVNADYNVTAGGRPVLSEDGMIRRFLGINFIHCERIVNTANLDGSGFAQVPLFARSGMYLGIWGDVMTSVDRRIDLSGLPWQVYAKGTFGGTRIEEKRVVNIKCVTT